MSVSPNNIVLYSSANMVSGDGVTTGGAVNFSSRVGFADVLTAGTMAWVSSSASDTAVTGIGVGRDSTGVIISGSHTLNGTTPVSGAHTYQRLLEGTISGTVVGDVGWISTAPELTGTAQGAGNTSGTVGPYITLAAGTASGTALQQIVRITNNVPSGVEYQMRRIVGTSGSTDTVFVSEDWTTVPTSGTTYEVHTGMLFERSPNSVTNIIRAFLNCVANAPGGSNLNFYSKVFAVNNNTATALTNVSVTLESTTPALPTGATLQFGLTSGLNDTATVANRQTAPTGITFTTGSLPQTSGVPSPGNLPSGTAPNTSGAEGVWFNLTLDAGTQPFDGSASIQISGDTT